MTANIEQELASALPLSKAGEKVAEYLSLVEGYEATPWSKNGEMRIYLRDVSYRNPKEAGYVRISPEGEVLTNFTRSVTAELQQAIFRLKAIIKVESNDLTKRPRTPEEVKAAIREGKKVSYKEVEEAMNQLYGRGKWDDRDREDFEG